MAHRITDANKNVIKVAGNAGGNDFNTSISNLQRQIDNIRPNNGSYAFYKYPDVTIGGTYDASVSITTKGRPVFVSLSGDINPTSNGAWTMIYLYRSGTHLTTHCVQSTGNSVNVPFNITYLDVVSAGTYTYTIRFEVGSGTIDLGENGSLQTPNFTVFEI